MTTEYTNQIQDDAVIDLGGVFEASLAHKWWVLFCLILVSAVFSAVALLSTPIYESVALLVPANTGKGGTSGNLGAGLGQLGGLASLAGIGALGSGGDTEEALAVLKSRELTARFINDLRLMPELFPEKWDPAASQWRVDVRKHPTEGRAFKRFDKNIRFVSHDKKTGLVTLRIRWRDREQAALWANELVKRLNVAMRQRAIAQTNAFLSYLEKELAATSVLATREAINRLIEAQIKQRMLANVTEDYAFRVVDKAVPADVDDPVQPRRLLMFLSGPVVGLFVGLVVALVLRRRGNVA